MRVDGVYSMGLCGYEVEVAEDGESVKYRFVGTATPGNEHHAKVQFTGSGRAFFVADGKRIHLDECLRNSLI